VKIKKHLNYHFKSLRIIKERNLVNFILRDVKTQITNFFQIEKLIVIFDDANILSLENDHLLCKQSY